MHLGRDTGSHQDGLAHAQWHLTNRKQIELARRVRPVRPVYLFVDRPGMTTKSKSTRKTISIRFELTHSEIAALDALRPCGVSRRALTYVLVRNGLIDAMRAGEVQGVSMNLLPQRRKVDDAKG